MAQKEVQFRRDTEINRIISTLKPANIRTLQSTIAQHIAENCAAPLALIENHLETQGIQPESCIGGGVAILPIQIKSRATSHTTLYRLQNALDLNAFDNQSVDLICVIYSPQSDGPLHLRRISRMTRLLKDLTLLQKIRSTDDNETIQALIHNPDGWMLAA